MVPVEINFGTLLVAVGGSHLDQSSIRTLERRSLSRTVSFSITSLYVSGVISSSFRLLPFCPSALLPFRPSALLVHVLPFALDPIVDGAVVGDPDRPARLPVAHEPDQDPNHLGPHPRDGLQPRAPPVRERGQRDALVLAGLPHDVPLPRVEALGPERRHLLEGRRAPGGEEVGEGLLVLGVEHDAGEDLLRAVADRRDDHELLAVGPLALDEIDLDTVVCDDGVHRRRPCSSEPMIHAALAALTSRTHAATGKPALLAALMTRSFSCALKRTV